MKFFLFSFYSQGPLRIGSRPTNSLNPVIKPVHFSSGVVNHGTVFAKKSVYSLMLVTDRPSGAPLAARAPPPLPPRSPPPALRPRPRPRPAAAPASPLHIDYITLKLSLVQSVTLLSEQWHYFEYSNCLSTSAADCRGSIEKYTKNMRFLRVKKATFLDSIVTISYQLDTECQRNTTLRQVCMWYLIELCLRESLPSLSSFFW